MELPSVAPLLPKPHETISEVLPESPRLTLLSKPRPIEPSRPHLARVLGVDIENRPDWYGGGDYVYDRIVCVSWKWRGKPDVETAFIDWRDTNSMIVHQLHPLWHALHEAEAFLGHNFRHDWKGIQTLFRELHQPPLERRPIIDTMRCIPSGIPRGLGDLCVRFGLGDKPHLTGRDWTDALERRVPAKIALVKHRNRQDVILTERLYWKERELGWI